MINKIRINATDPDDVDMEFQDDIEVTRKEGVVFLKIRGRKKPIAFEFDDLVKAFEALG